MKMYGSRKTKLRRFVANQINKRRNSNITKRVVNNQSGMTKFS